MTAAMDKTFELPETRAGRSRRRRRRISVATVVVVLVAGAVWIVAEVSSTCGWPGSGVYRADGECVGVTDGSFLFDDEFADVEKKIVDENAWVQTQDSYVTVALLNPLTAKSTSVLSRNEILGQLEGAYIAQYRINHTTVVGDVRPPIKLVLANEGSTQNQWRPVVGTLVEMARRQDNPLVAVVGMGVSICETEQAAMELARNGIPMVGAIISAAGLEYSKINGLIRVSPDNQEYAHVLDGFLRTQTGFRSAVVVYDINSDSNCDLFTKTMRTAVKDKMAILIKFNDLSYRGGGLDENAGASQFASLTPNICAARPDVILYTGRRGDLSGFLGAMGNRVCRNTPAVVIVTGTDPTAVLRGQEKELRDANIMVFSVATTDAGGWDQNRSVAPEHYPDFRGFFTKFKFDPAHLAADRVMTMHDAVLAAAKAVRLAALDAARPGAPTAVEVRDQLMNLHGLNAVPGASGTLSFSYREPGAGNPRGNPCSWSSSRRPHRGSSSRSARPISRHSPRKADAAADARSATMRFFQGCTTDPGLPAHLGLRRACGTPRRGLSVPTRRIAAVPDDDLESRFSRLEHQVSRLREDVASARALAALADRDVAELRTEMRAHHKVLNALRETQLEQGKQLDELRQEMHQEIGELRQEMHQEIGELRQEMHQEIGGLRQEMHQEIGELRQEMHQEIGGLRQEMQQGFAMQSTGMAQILTLLTTIADHKQ